MPDQHILLKGQIEGMVAEGKLFVAGATVRERFSELTDMTIEFTCPEITMRDLVGQGMALEVDDNLTDSKRYFAGTCVSIERIGKLETGDGTRMHYVAKVRHWLWMLTRATDNRIFQNKTAVQVIEEVFGDHGFSDYTKKLSESYEEREYCVQYRETDYDFVCRLMEEEGMYFFFDTAPGTGEINKLVLCDDKGSSHAANPVQGELNFTASGGREAEGGEDVTDWSHSENVISGKVTLNDFDMLVPRSDLEVVEMTTARMNHTHKSYELYHYPGKYRKDTNRGKRHARVRMEAVEVRFQTRRAASNGRHVSTGYKFTLKEADAENGSYVVIGATHYLRPKDTQQMLPGRLDRKRPDLTYPDEMEKDDYVVYFDCLPAQTQFRAPLTTPWPEISGLHTAIVVGKPGEEIWTDEHGRIKVQFHWDRDGQMDENSTCWIRVATPWSGKDWGFVAIPRMGQEVVIQFEEGDPDRPICTGMLWNEETKPAWAYPDNATQLGIRTNSSKGGGGYNELMWEDKAGEELMRVQAQKDHQFLIKNKSVVTIGQEEVDAGDHDDEGSLSEVIRNNVTRTIQEGNHYHTIQTGDEEFKIETGSQTIEIATDKTQTITQNYSTTIEQGNHDTEVSLGNLSINVAAGSISLEAMQEIKLTVGGSSITINQMGITITGAGTVDVGSPMTTVTGDGMLTLRGGLTKIN